MCAGQRGRVPERHDRRVHRAREPLGPRRAVGSARTRDLPRGPEARQPDAELVGRARRRERGAVAGGADRARAFRFDAVLRVRRRLGAEARRQGPRAGGGPVGVVVGGREIVRGRGRGAPVLREAAAAERQPLAVVLHPSAARGPRAKTRGFVPGGGTAAALARMP